MAILFDPDNGQHIDCGVNPGSAADLSVSWWMTAGLLDNVVPIDKKPTLGTVGWYMKVRSDGNINFRIGSDDDSEKVIGASIYAANTRVHIVCTFGSGTAKIYGDGVLFGTTNGITQTPDDTVSPLYVGRQSSAAGEGFDGLLEDVRVYDTIITPEEVAEIYAAQGLDMNMRILPHLQLRLPMRGENGASIGTVKDFSPNGYDGTPTGSPVPVYVPGLVRLARMS